jgi:hypothetical protein
MDVPGIIMGLWGKKVLMGITPSVIMGTIAIIRLGIIR